MKNLIIMVCIVLAVGMTQAQEKVLLDPVVIEHDAQKVFTASNVEGANFIIEEERFNEFFEDPIGFAKKNFDITPFKLEEDTECEVKFTCSKGYLQAVFNKSGDLVSTRQRYKDILVPADLRDRLLEEHKGWTMVRNKYIAEGEGDQINKEVFKIKLVEMNGNGVKRIEMVPGERPDERLAEGGNF
jgi:hypothetical protein